MNGSLRIALADGVHVTIFGLKLDAGRNHLLDLALGPFDDYRVALHRVFHSGWQRNRFLSYTRHTSILYGLRVPTNVVPLQPGPSVPPDYYFHSMPTAWPRLMARARTARSSARPAVREALPDFAKDLATDTFTARLASGHHAARRGKDADAESTLHALDLVAADIHTAAGTRNAGEIANRSFVVRAVLEVHAKNVAAVLFGGLVVRDVALFLEDAGDFGL